MTELNRMTEVEIELKSRLDVAFSAVESAEITKRQFCPSGRKIFLPIMAGLATILYVIFMVFSSIITIQFRLVVMPIETLVWLFFMLRFLMSFITDVKSEKFAEKIVFTTDSAGKKYFYGEGRYVKKFEYDGGNIVLWGKNNYEKYLDKRKYNLMASRYDKHLQRRSCNFGVISAEFLFENLRENCVLTENGAQSETEHGSFSIKFEDGFIKSVYYVGKAELLYDSASPIHIFDCFLPFNYVISYTFKNINQIKKIAVPIIVKTAINDYLFTSLSSDSIEFV